MTESDDEAGRPLTPRSFVNWIDGEVVALTSSVIVPGKTVDEYNILRGKIIELKKAREVFLNRQER